MRAILSWVFARAWAGNKTSDVENQKFLDGPRNPPRRREPRTVDAGCGTTRQRAWQWQSRSWCAEQEEEQEKGSSGLHLFHVPSSLRSIHPSEQTSEQRDLTWSGRRMAAVLREEDGLHRRRQGLPLSLPPSRSVVRPKRQGCTRME